MATGTYTEVVKVASGKNFTLEAAGPNVVIAALDHQSKDVYKRQLRGFASPPLRFQ